MIPDVHSTQKLVTIKETFHLTSHVTESEKRSDKITTTAGHGISNIANKGISNVKIKTKNCFLVRFMWAMKVMIIAWEKSPMFVKRDMHVP